jgi:diguanylate cyclase (GGDEF)-like protein
LQKNRFTLQCLDMRFFKLIPLRNLQEQAKTWQWVLLALTLLIGSMFTYYVMQSEDTEMRDGLITYANTIERSIDWRPFENVLNTNPNNITTTDLSGMNAQLNDACRANRDCHFIYLLYMEKSDVKFLLDASPQPASEISKLAEVFVEATGELKEAMLHQKPLVEGPVTDHWGTWVSARVPVKITLKGNHFAMLNVDVAVTDWQSRIYKKALVPIMATLIFLGILLWLVYKNKEREQLYSALFTSTSELAEIANNDELTGLPNRRLLEDRIAQAIKSAVRTWQIVAVLFLDLDNFKTVNDTFGHPVGDQLLKLVATRLKGLLRVEDTVARVGGDEFIILLSNLTSELQAITMAEKVVKVLTDPFQVEGVSLKIGVSVGVSLYPEHDVNEKNLIKYSDSAMYAAKRQGRNCYVLYRDNL